MRTAAIVLSIVTLTSLAMSQISLSSSDMQSMFAPGKSWRYLENNNLSITLNIGTASPLTQTWTFPAITYADTVRDDNLLPSSTPYASKYPRATHVQRYSYSDMSSSSAYYEYYRITADSMINLGGVSRIQGNGMDTTYYNYSNHLIMLFPFTYGKTISSRDSSSSYPGAYLIIRITTVCDAFGTVNIPSGSFQALRMKETSISQQIFGGMPFSTDTSVSYTWFTRDGFSVSTNAQDKNPTGSSILVSGISYMTIINTPTGVAGAGNLLPSNLQLSQNYPNPFNPSTVIEYVMPKGGYVKLTVHNALGQEVASLMNGFQEAGRHALRFDATGLPSGVYFYRLTTNAHVSVGKMNLVK